MESLSYEYAAGLIYVIYVPKKTEHQIFDQFDRDKPWIWWTVKIPAHQIQYNDPDWKFKFWDTQRYLSTAKWQGQNLFLLKVKKNHAYLALVQSQKDLSGS